MIEGLKQPWQSDAYVAARLNELSKQWREQAYLNSSDYGIASAMSASKIFSEAASIIIGGLQRDADCEARQKMRAAEARGEWAGDPR